MALPSVITHFLIARDRMRQTAASAQRLFGRQGFQHVVPEAVAAEKWQGYDPARRAQVAVYRRDLTPDVAP